MSGAGRVWCAWWLQALNLLSLLCLVVDAAKDASCLIQVNQPAASLSATSTLDQWIPRMMSFPVTTREPWMRSQGIQDLFIREIFQHIGVSSKYYVEFGYDAASFEQQAQCGPNTGALRDQGWTGLLLDGNHENASINLHKHFLFQNNIVDLFKKYKVPKDLGYLSVDMDSHDFFVLKSILNGGYRPALFTAEYNANYGGKPIAITMLDPTLPTGEVPKGFEFKFSGCSWGASAYALNMLAEEHGYKLIGRVDILDLCFLRKDLISPDWEVPSFDWYFQGGKGTRKMHQDQTDAKILDRMADYTTWRETGDLQAAKKRASELLKQQMGGTTCWSQVVR
ncbi:unnamed protein product [Symbiodinium natans]|uniref:Thiamine pyrimidine synthase n=1 Tax=Symbiodinium natans TaxID=878477 RepID=A0A812JL19_9DINO|nr:unnamed protein product [Symbiodinium natans]